MAEQYSGLDIPLIASSGMDASAYYFVKMSAGNTISICSASTDVAIGVLQSSGVGDQSASVRISGHTKISLSETIAVGQLISPSATGAAQAVTASSDDDVYVAGVCTVGGDAGEIGEMIMAHATRLLSGFASNAADETITGSWTFNEDVVLSGSISIGTASPAAGFRGVGDIYATSGIKAMEGLYSEAVTYGAGWCAAANGWADGYD